MKETISDYLRYILLVLAIALLVFLIFITIKVYQRYDNSSDDDDTIQILTEVETEAIKKTMETETITEHRTESELLTEKETVKNAEMPRSNTETSEKSSEPSFAEGSIASDQNPAEALQDQKENADSENSNIDNSNTEDSNIADSDIKIEDIPLPDIRTPETQALTEPPVETEPPKPVYGTIISTCYLRSYPDYGDNILGECYTGMTVEFLGPEAGWFKVNADGVIGYIGPRFLSY